MLTKQLDKYYAQKFILCLNQEVIPEEYDRLFLKNNGDINIYIKPKAKQITEYEYLMTIKESDALQALIEAKTYIKRFINQKIAQFEEELW